MADLIDSLIGYVNDIKPYHTKIFGVEVEYVSNDDIRTTVIEDLKFKLQMGLPTCQYLESLAIAVGDDDGFGATPYDGLGWDIIIAEDDGYCIAGVGAGGGKRYFFGGQEYVKPHGLIDYVFTAVTETIVFEGDLARGDVEDVHTRINRRWDQLLDGVGVIGYKTNAIIVKGDMTPIFGIVPGMRVTLGYSSFNDGVYTIDNAIYDPNKHQTQITVMESGFDIRAIDGLVLIGAWDAYEWDGDSSTVVAQPDADINAQSTIGESLQMVDGIGWDDLNNNGWDGTVDFDRIVPTESYHNSTYYSQPAKWDEAYFVLNGYSTTMYNPNIVGGWEGYLFDDHKWDMETSEKDTEKTEGIVVFSPEKMPAPIATRSGSIHEQTTASTVWVIDHYRGYYPIIRVFVGGEEVLPLDITHTNLNQTIVSFTSPTTGMARYI